jgi:DNA polymerase-3 subunit epsilon
MHVEELSELGVLIVDCQTTGATPALGAVLEIGWGIARASEPRVERLEAHWIALPERHFVGFQVRRLTGFDESEVTNALAPKEAWERLRATTEFAARMPAAIHFAKFELAFLRDWAAKFEPETSFPLDAVCVHAIACRLYPDLPRRSIRALAGFLGHGVDLARRSAGHVEATAFIWHKLVAELASQGVTTWQALGEWLAAPKPPARRKRRYPFPSARWRALPDEPGVYRFVRSNGDVLYVGKATSLRKRVAGHFTAGTSTTERALEMLTQVHDIVVTPTRTALEAALLEIEDIRALRPPYNVQLVGDDPRTWFTTKDLDAASTRPDDVHRRGPLPSTFAVRALGAIRAIASGEHPSRVLRARAVEAPERWAPDERVFTSGFAVLADRHRLPVPSPPGSKKILEAALVAAARNLLLSAKDADDAADEESAPSTWDTARVVRHLERAVAHGYQLLQRARWLCLLYDSAVVFTEPGPAVERTRILLVRGGRLVEARDFLPGEAVPDAAAPSPTAARQAAFDRHHYDRLRTLTTELKRVLRDHGSAAVRVGRRRWLRGNALEALLRWV